MEYRLDQEILDAFIDETHDHLQYLEACILKFENLDSAPSPSLLESMFRTAHSMKASASLLGLPNIEKLSHELENILDLIRKEGKTIDSDGIDAFLKGIDQLNKMIKLTSFSDELNIQPVLEILDKTRIRMTNQ